MVCHSNETSVAGRNLNFLVNFSLATVKSRSGLKTRAKQRILERLPHNLAVPLKVKELSSESKCVV